MYRVTPENQYESKWFVDIIDQLNNQEDINKLFQLDNSSGESDNLEQIRKTIINGMYSTQDDYRGYKRPKELFLKMLSILTENEILFNTLFNSDMITKFNTLFKNDIDLFDNVNYSKNAGLAISLSNKLPQEVIRYFSSQKEKPSHLKYIFHILRAFHKITMN